MFKKKVFIIPDKVEKIENIEKYATQFLCGWNWPKRIILSIIGQSIEKNVIHRHACIKHDIRYRLGGTRQDKLYADICLLVDMYSDASDNNSYFTRKRKEMVASMYFRLVRAFGFFTFKWSRKKRAINKLNLR